MREGLRQRAPEVWDWVINPADQSILAGTAVSGMDILEMMAERPEFDVLIGNVGEDWILGLPVGDSLLQHVVERFIQIGRQTSKPMAVVLGPADSPEEWRWQVMAQGQQRLVSAGLPVYPNIERAGRAMGAFVRYHRQRQGLEPD
jgi:hypothetical protein